MIKFIQKTFLTFFLLGLLFSYSKAAETILPEVMVGNPRVMYGAANSTNIYGGFSGSETVFNHTNDSSSTNPKPVFGPGQTMGANFAPSVGLSGSGAFINGGTGSVISGRGPFAVSLWFKRSGSTGNTEMLSTQFGMPHVDDYKLQIQKATDPNPNHVTFRVWGVSDCNASNPNYGLSVNGPAILPADTAWHHALAQRVITPTGQRLELWVDGISYSVSDNNPSQIVCLDNNNSTSTAVKTGVGATPTGDPSNLPEYFKGSVDDPRIYNRALSGTEVTSLHYGRDISSADLKAHWTLDESSGVFADSSGNNNTATAVGSITRNSTDGPTPVDTSQYDNYGYDLFGFDSPTLTTCINGMIFGTTPDNCFVANSSMDNVTVLNSRTYVNDQSVTEVATLMYPPKPLIVGDAYLGSLDPSNFAYWGKNLVENDSSHNTSSNSYWGVGSYTNALASDLASYQKKIDSASKEAVVPQSLPTSTNWYLQGTTINADNANSDSTKYSNGKIWNKSVATSNTTITGNITYSGVGTIIFNGNLTINSGVSIQSANGDTTSRLGIVVTGNVTMVGNNNIKATILSYGDMSIGSNSTLTGSFVAKTFSTLSPTPPTITNTRLVYDTGLNKSWPPIFGELNMPHASEQ